jgi:CheY-like chemotaxis protein
LARKILLADDSVTAQNMGRKILTDAGYEVITVNNGSAALKKIAEGKPDLIVLDVYMPGYSGLEVCQRIKENRDTSRIPILLTVGKLEPFKPEEARRAKADAFVVKPFEASELLSALTKLEDKIIPGAEPYKPGRFAKAIATVEREEDTEQFGDLDEGWKARLRIPTGQPKEKDNEPPVDYAATQGKGFRDLMEPAGRKSTPKPAAFERPIPAGLPPDITPEEIAAITAAAAQLSGAAPAPSAAEPAAVSEPAPGVPAEPAAATLQAETSLADTSDDETPPATFASAPELEDAPAARPAPGSAVESQTAPALAHVEAPAEASSAGTGRVAEAPVPAAEVPAEDVRSAAEVLPVSGSTAAGSPVVPALEEPAHTAPAPPAEAQESAPQPVAESAAVPPTAPPVPEPAPAEPVTLAGAKPVPTPAEISEAPSSAAPPPSQDDEVMAALHALIPADAAPASGPAIAKVALGSEAPVASASTQLPPSGPRWMAEEVLLSAEEAVLALDSEMEMAAAVVQAAPASISPRAAQAEETPAAHAAAATPEPAAQQVPEVYAVATAAGAEFPAPWPVGNSPAPPQALQATVAAGSAEVVPETAAAQAAPHEDAGATNTQSEGGTDIMAASWKNIRDSIAGSAAKPAPAKEEFADAPASGPQGAPSEASRPGTAAPPEPAPEGTGASNPAAIANIVDSVLAELRPRIVEEIARKLADPKK